MLSALMEKAIIVYLQCDKQMLPFADMAKNILILLLPSRQLTFFNLRRYTVFPGP